MSEDHDDPAALFYSGDESVSSTYHPAIADGVGQLSDVAGWTEEERSAHALALAHACSDAKLSQGEAAIFVSHLAQYSKDVPDDDTLRSWELESRRALREQYGVAEGDRRMALAQQFVENRPELHALLNQTGVGSHPKVVRMIAERAGAPGSNYSIRVTPRRSR